MTVYTPEERILAGNAHRFRSLFTIPTPIRCRLTRPIPGSFPLNTLRDIPSELRREITYDMGQPMIDSTKRPRMSFSSDTPVHQTSYTHKEEDENDVIGDEQMRPPNDPGEAFMLQYVHGIHYMAKLEAHMYCGYVPY